MGSWRAAVIGLALLGWACAPSTAPAARSVVDQGAAARDAVLARYDGDRPFRATPDVVGLTAVAAADALEEAGLAMDLVPFDRAQPVTRQFPDPGQPAPPDGEVQVWLGTPPPAEVAARPTADPTPTPTDEPTDEPTEQPTEQATAPTTVATRYVLPPHTPGRLRINPRFLAPVPAGTQLDGLASWYGPGFHGLTTACGGIYDQNGATLATRELRCGTVVRITGPTGLTVEATVTDWGPAEWAGRRFDLSAAVFNAIAPLSAGVIPVRVITVNQPR